ncbi:MAG TPA: sigma-70 family RNA polymerase sigma factor [Planctomicrobium sp.]|nr:sigma-70 family RNA polymerase sigma factor [Planctomicrobium sp.]
MSTITPILNQIWAGDATSHEQLSLIYMELRRLASFKLKNAPPGQTLQPTVLVHEAFLRLAGGNPDKKWANRGHFFSAAGEAMRHILVENARRRKSLKRGGHHVHLMAAEEHAIVEPPDAEELLDLDAALSKLATSDPELARLVELRYFAGLTIEQTAETLNISPRTVKRNWAFARAWLGRELGLGEENSQ